MMKTLKKTAVLLLSGTMIASVAVGLSACGKSEDPPVEGESYTLSTSKSPEKLDADEVLYAFLQKQSELQSYMITAEGTAVASLAGYKQSIHNITYKSGEDYLNEASSSSALVKMKHQSFSKGGKVVYRNSFDGEMKVADKAEYKKVYGFTADEVTLGGYIINPKTLRYAELESAEGDTLTYYFRLAGDQSLENGTATESATPAIRLQSKAYGSLDNLPAFSDVDLRLTIKKDWTPVSYVSTCTYKAKKMFKMSIKQTITSTYSHVNEEVDIPSVEEFNQKLGTEPSEPLPPQEGDPLMQLSAALGATLGEENAAKLPVSVGLSAFGAKNALSGELALKIRQDALEEGDVADAFSLRFDLSLAGMPLISKLANTLTVRYEGGGLLLLMLNNRAEGKDRYLFTYSADITGVFSSAAEGGLEGLIADMGSFFAVEKTEKGFALSLKEETIAKVNAAYQGFLTSLAQKWGDTHGYILSLLGANFTGVTADLAVKAEAGAEKIAGVALDLDGSLENVTLGEKIAVSIDTKLIGGAIAQPFTGELQLRLNPAAIWSGDYFALAKAHLRLDLTPASNLIMLIGMLGNMIPNLPSWLNAELSSLDIYYTGDGILTLAFNNAEGLPMGMTEVDLRSLLSGGLPAIPGLGGEGQTGLPQFTLEVKENGIRFALGDNIVTALATAYNGLIDSLVEKAKAGLDDFTAMMADQMLRGWLGGQITGVEFFLGKTEEGKPTFDFAIHAIPANEADSVRFIGLTIAYKEELTEGESADLTADKVVGDLKVANEKAKEYAEKLQKFIDEMDVTEGGYAKYVEAVTALQNEINGQDPAVKTLMSNSSYLAETSYQDKNYSVLLLTAELYRARAETFKTTVAEITADSEETAWDELNALYDRSATISGIVVPAIKENEVLKTAVGDDTIQTYLTKRNTHETKLANELKTAIAAAKTTFNAEENQNRDGWTDALTKIVNEFKPVYDKLPAELQENTGYQDFVALVYEKNVDELTKAYKEIKGELEALIAQGSDASIDELLKTMKKLSSAYAWYYGYDYWMSNLDNASTAMEWGKTWITALKPTWLEETAQVELNQKVTDLTALNRELIKGTTEKSVATALKDVIKQAVAALYDQIGSCRSVSEEDGTVTWDFSKLSLGDEETSALLEKIHGIRFMICKVLTTDLFDDWEDETLLQFARIDLTKYETALAEYLEGKSAPQA